MNCDAFAHQTLPQGEPPRAYLERVYNIQRWTVFPRGGQSRMPATSPSSADTTSTAGV